MHFKGLEDLEVRFSVFDFGKVCEVFALNPVFWFGISGGFQFISFSAFSLWFSVIKKKMGFSVFALNPVFRFGISGGLLFTSF